MSILKVARMGHPVLRERARAVSKTELRDPLMQKLIDDMIDTMHEYHGVGLAAPQVHEGLRLFVALLEEDPGPKSKATVIVNPEIVPSASTQGRGLGGVPEHPGHSRDGSAVHRDRRVGSRPQRQGDRAAAEEFRRRVSRSTRRITSTACCSSTA